jgi:dienelactone hydrolase
MKGAIANAVATAYLEGRPQSAQRFLLFPGFPISKERRDDSVHARSSGRCVLDLAYARRVREQDRETERDTPPQHDAAVMEARATPAASTLRAALPNATTIDDAEEGGFYDAVHAVIGPTYRGSVNNSRACTKSYATRGFAPNGPSGARYPLFLYFVGTKFVAGDESVRYDGLAPMAVAEAMARRGFFALAVEYDNGFLALISDHVNQLACLFDDARAESLIARACALPSVDCEQGIGIWGHSQGGYVAVMAHNEEPRVRAAWTTGYGGDGAWTLPRNKLRVVNGEADGTNGDVERLGAITGMDPQACADPDQCLRQDGSGFIVVRRAHLADPASSSADHCWFDRTRCAAREIRLEPTWTDPRSTAPFSLESNADWLARAATE